MHISAIVHSRSTPGQPFHSEALSYEGTVFHLMKEEIILCAHGNDLVEVDERPPRQRFREEIRAFIVDKGINGLSIALEANQTGLPHGRLPRSN